MADGVVTWFNAAKGYGYIAAGDGSGPVFLPRMSLGADLPAPGDAVSFDVDAGRGFKRAVNVALKRQA